MRNYPQPKSHQWKYKNKVNLNRGPLRFLNLWPNWMSLRLIAAIIWYHLEQLMASITIKGLWWCRRNLVTRTWYSQVHSRPIISIIRISISLNTANSNRTCKSLLDPILIRTKWLIRMVLNYQLIGNDLVLQQQIIL